MDGKEGKRMNKKKQAGQACLLAAALVLPAASMIKIFILAKAYEDIQSGSLRRNETFTLTPDNVVGGAGILQGRGYGTRVSLQEALNLMITESTTQPPTCSSTDWAWTGSIRTCRATGTPTASCVGK